MDNKVLLKEIRVHLTLFEQLTDKLNTFNDLTDLTNSITFFTKYYCILSAKSVCTACYIYWLIHVNREAPVPELHF